MNKNENHTSIEKVYDIDSIQTYSKEYDQWYNVAIVSNEYENHLKKSKFILMILILHLFF